MSDQSDLDKRRRDLYAISLGLIIYNVAGGSLLPAATTLFGTVTITRTIVLSVGAWIAWGYFLWQFRLVANPVMRPFWEDIDEEMYRSSKYAEYSSRVLRCLLDVASAPMKYHGQIEATTQQLGAMGGYKDALESLVSGNRVILMRPGSHGKTFQPSFRSSDAQARGALFNEDTPVWQFALSQNPWAESMRFKIRFLARLRAIKDRHAFSDRVLPLWIAGLAPFIQIARLIKHSIYA